MSRGESIQAHRVRRGHAAVTLEPRAEREAFIEQVRAREEARDAEFFRHFSSALLAPERRRVYVTLSAEMEDGSLVPPGAGI